MKNPKVSVIVPIYNVERYLSQCLNSIINQTYKNIEIICINDGSTDNSFEILNSYASIDARIIVINQKNIGLSGTRNKGVEISSGEFIMFVDSDDWIDLNTCQLVVSKALETESDVILWPYIREYDNKSKKKEIFHQPIIVFSEHEAEEQLYRRLFGPLNKELMYPENIDALVTACMKLYRSSIIKENNLLFIDTKEIGTEDALFNIYYFGYVRKAVYLNEYLYHYRRDNDSSLTTKYKPDLFSQWRRLFNYMEEYIILNNLDSKFMESLNNRIALSIIGLGLNELNNNKGTIESIRVIKKIISSPKYKNAYTNLKLNNFPMHWKAFFLFAKLNSAIALYLLLSIINKLR